MAYADALNIDETGHKDNGGLFISITISLYIKHERTTETATIQQVKKLQAHTGPREFAVLFVTTFSSLLSDSSTT